MNQQPMLLVDDSLLAGTVNVMPRQWLAGLRVKTFTSGERPAISPELQAATAILTRSVSPIDAEVLARAANLRAVATTSSGTDHIDSAALQTLDVPLFTGRGGNAPGVHDWVLWALWRAWGLPLTSGGARGKTVVVVGCGAVGRLVTTALGQWGAEVLQVDPPRARRDVNFAGVSLDEAIARRPDAVTLHVPLTHRGPDATAHLLNATRLQHLRGAAVLNAARGPVLDEQKAATMRKASHLSFLALDTFANEPTPSRAVIEAADLATAHIAGHSIEGKLRVSALPIQGLRDHLGLAKTVDLDDQIRARRQNPPGGIGPAINPLVALDGASRALKDGAAPFKTLRAQHWRCEMQPLWGQR